MRCAACGRPIYAAKFSHVVTLARYWTHYSWWANHTHRAIPENSDGAP